LRHLSAKKAFLRIRRTKSDRLTSANFLVLERREIPLCRAAMNHLSKLRADEGEFNLFWVDELKNVNFRCSHTARKSFV